MIRANEAQRLGMIDRTETLPALLGRVVAEGGKAAARRCGPAWEAELERARLALTAPSPPVYGDSAEVGQERLALGLMRGTHVRVDPAD